MTSRMNNQSTHTFRPTLHPAAARLADHDRTGGRAAAPAVGCEAIAERLGSQLLTATGDISWLLNGDEQDVTILESVAAVEPGRLRILQHGGDQPLPRSLAAAQLRVTCARPGHDFLLVGEDISFIFDRDEAGRQVMTPVPQASVCKAFLGFFELLWSAALPVMTELQQELGSEARRVIIRMLGDGATDDAIARALGISRRTTARHVARIMHCTGSLSRFQAGMRLAQLGLAGGRS